MTSPLHGDGFTCIHHSSASRSQGGNAHYDLILSDDDVLFNETWGQAAQPLSIPGECFAYLFQYRPLETLVVDHYAAAIRYPPFYLRQECGARVIHTNLLITLLHVY